MDITPCAFVTARGHTLSPAAGLDFSHVSSVAWQSSVEAEPTGGPSSSQTSDVDALLAELGANLAGSEPASATKEGEAPMTAAQEFRKREYVEAVERAVQEAAAEAAAAALDGVEEVAQEAPQMFGVKSFTEIMADKRKRQQAAAAQEVSWVCHTALGTRHRERTRSS
jgi:hypothetical protein